MLTRLLFSGGGNLPTFTIKAAKYSVSSSIHRYYYIGYNAVSGGTISSNSFIFNKKVYYLTELADETKYYNIAFLDIKQDNEYIYPSVKLSINGTIHTFSYNKEHNALTAPKIGFTVGSVYTIKIISIE